MQITTAATELPKLKYWNQDNESGDKRRTNLSHQSNSYCQSSRSLPGLEGYKDKEGYNKKKTFVSGQSLMQQDSQE